MTGLVCYNKLAIIHRILNCGNIIHPDIGTHIRCAYIQLMQRQHMNESVDKMLMVVHNGFWTYTYITPTSINKLLNNPCGTIIRRALTATHSTMCPYNDHVCIGIHYVCIQDVDTFRIDLRPCYCDGFQLWDNASDNVNYFYLCKMELIVEFLRVLYLGNCIYYKDTEIFGNSI